jgi:hypothetical protein
MASTLDAEVIRLLFGNDDAAAFLFGLVPGESQ